MYGTITEQKIYQCIQKCQCLATAQLSHLLGYDKSSEDAARLLVEIAHAVQHLELSRQISTAQQRYLLANNRVRLDKSAVDVLWAILDMWENIHGGELPLDDLVPAPKDYAPIKYTFIQNGVTRYFAFIDGMEARAMLHLLAAKLLFMGAGSDEKIRCYVVTPDETLFSFVELTLPCQSQFLYLKHDEGNVHLKPDVETGNQFPAHDMKRYLDLVSLSSRFNLGPEQIENMMKISEALGTMGVTNERLTALLNLNEEFRKANFSDQQVKVFLSKIGEQLSQFK